MEQKQQNESEKKNMEQKTEEKKGRQIQKDRETSRLKEGEEY